MIKRLIMTTSLIISYKVQHMKNLFNPADEFVNNEKIILRDYLALERTKLANERTLFSYIRTSLYLLTVGIGIFEIKSISHLAPIGWVCNNGLLSSGNRSVQIFPDEIASKKIFDKKERRRRELIF